jgi:threonylcarbamoyladenosine tRNA methylthiotransferase MtaB
MKPSSKFFVQTFGCRCNQADSAGFRHALCSTSLEEAQSPSDADLIVVNTCTVTHRTDQQVRQALRKLHRENPDARLVVAGCYAERAPETLAAIPGVDLVIGNADRERFGEIVADEAAARIVHGPFDQSRDFLIPRMSSTGGKTRPFVKLQDGCDARCSYCIVPSVRGPGRSAHPDSVVAEVLALIDSGYQEIVLTGVNLGEYGRKFDERVKMSDLLLRLVSLPGLGRLRLSSIEPMRFDRAIVKLAAENPLVARHFHLPLQSGSDRILRRMRRPYTVARYRELLDLIYESIPAAALGTDVLVGFPGETDADFQSTLSTIRESPLTYLHVFPFSGREGTDAYRLEDQVPPQVIQERASILRTLGQEKNFAFRRSFVGRILPALTLAREEELGDSIVLTDNYIHARVHAHERQPNRLVHIRIDAVHPATTLATIGHHRG